MVTEDCRRRFDRKIDEPCRPLVYRDGGNGMALIAVGGAAGARQEKMVAAENAATVRRWPRWRDCSHPENADMAT